MQKPVLSHPQLAGGKESWEEWAQGLRIGLCHTAHTCAHVTRTRTAHMCTRPRKHTNTCTSNECTQHPCTNISKHILTCTHSAQAGVHPGTWGVRGKWESVGEHGEKAQGPACCCGGRARPHAHPLPYHGQCRELGLSLRVAWPATPQAGLLCHPRCPPPGPSVSHLV